MIKMIIFPRLASGTFQGALSFVETSSYIAIFIAMIIEGPVVTTAAAFAASLGFFNIIWIFILSLLGDLIGDLLHYGTGRIIRKSVIEVYGRKLGISSRTMERMKKHMKNHLGKTMVLFKFTPILTMVGLLLTGALKAPLRRFLLLSFLITLPRTIFFVGLGYFFGIAVSSVLRYFNLGGYILPFIAVIAVMAYFAYKKVSQKVAERV